MQFTSKEKYKVSLLTSFEIKLQGKNISNIKMTADMLFCLLMLYWLIKSP